MWKNTKNNGKALYVYIDLCFDHILKYNFGLKAEK